MGRRRRTYTTFPIDRHHDFTMAQVEYLDDVCFINNWSCNDFHARFDAGANGVAIRYGVKMAGYMVFTRIDSTIRIDRFAVNHDFRRRGIGTRLLGAAAAYVSFDLPSIFAVVSGYLAYSDEVTGFFRALGFKKTQFEHVNEEDDDMMITVRYSKKGT